MGRDERLGLQSLAIHSKIETSPSSLFTSPIGPPCDTRTPRTHHLSTKQHDNAVICSLLASLFATPTSSNRGASIRPSNPSPLPTSSLSPRSVYQLGAPPHMGHQAIEPPARKCSGRRLPLHLLVGSCGARAKMDLGVHPRRMGNRETRSGRREALGGV